MKTLKNTITIFILTALLLIVSIPNAEAQMTEFGLRFMPTYSSLDMQTSTGGTVKGEVTLGYGFGALLGFNFTDNVGIQTELIYNTLSQKYKENDTEYRIKLKYINIPLLFSLNSGKTKPVNFNLVVGPQLGISVGTNVVKASGGAPDDPPAVLSVKKGDIGIAYGAGLDFALNAKQTLRLGLGFRNVYGLVDISDNSSNTTTDDYYILDRTNIRTYSIYTGVTLLF